jgi:hypothetical protein
MGRILDVENLNNVFPTLGLVVIMYGYLYPLVNAVAGVILFLYLKNEMSSQVKCVPIVCLSTC